MTELSTRFDFKSIDDKWSKYWEEKNTFHGKKNPDKDPYSIVIPPPNVTGILHMGHALNNTLQDIILRYKRMAGFETCWMPGTDHAGIATQNVVEKALAKEGKKRQDVGREAFIEKLWNWKQEYGDTIIHQLKKLGSSCDWPRTRFTMDDGYSDAVKEVFARLYEKGLIYQGKYIINWCPRCHTALSDEEAEHQDTAGKLYHIKYPFKDNPKEFVIVATTRPETMLGDTAVAVNPKDKRYKKLIGKTLILPLIEREMTIIKDDFVDPEFGTGCVKVTPAHDPNDFMMGKRHDLEFVNIMHENGVINENGGAYNGLDRFEARKKIIADLESKGLLVKIDEHAHAVGHCYRCDTIVEPYLSKQWFVKMEPLAKPAREVVEKGKIKFYPERWTKVYMNWMENIRDWCISRQIWWGHRIPVWYCPDCAEGENIIVSKNTPTECPKCNSKKIKQDEDVLDTWFSSWLWPFATFNWPQEDEDLKYFYPTSSLFTASEIIFFWVARMVMAGIEFMGDIPFSEVYIHGTVRDEKGRKMSKSLGNALDPLEIIEEYGADALRFSLIINSGQDLFISKDKFEIGRNFANKIWNATRLILMNTKDFDASFELENVDLKKLDLPTQWIISNFFTTAKKVSIAIEGFKYSEAESLVYNFFWNDFCGWYLEIIKNNWADKNIQNVTVKILENSLKIISPFMPFVTEEIWSQLTHTEGEVCLQDWPKSDSLKFNSNVDKDMENIIGIISAIRNTRAEWNIKPNEKIECIASSSTQDSQTFLDMNKDILINLGKLSKLNVENKDSQAQNAATAIVGDIKVSIPLEGIIDLDAEKRKTEKELEAQRKAFENLSKRLNNKNFTDKAPKDVVAKEKERLLDFETKITKLEDVLSALG